MGTFSRYISSRHCLKWFDISFLSLNSQITINFFSLLSFSLHFTHVTDRFRKTFPISWLIMPSVAFSLGIDLKRRGTELKSRNSKLWKSRARGRRSSRTRWETAKGFVEGEVLSLVCIKEKWKFYFRVLQIALSKNTGRVNKKDETK